MMYKALDIAKYVINKCTVEECPISNLQLQKILYYIQREFLQLGRQQAFVDQIEAWQFGPVVPSVYRVYSGFGGSPIKIQYSIDGINGIDGVDLSQDYKKIIDPIVERKRRLRPWDMVGDTHAPEKAWALTYREGKGIHQIIQNQLIKIYG